MPRVHGIDIAPRRGKGRAGGGRSRPSAAAFGFGGGSNNYAVSSSSTAAESSNNQQSSAGGNNNDADADASPLADFSMSLEDAPLNHHEAFAKSRVNDIDGGALRMPLDSEEVNVNGNARGQSNDIGGRNATFATASARSSMAPSPSSAVTAHISNMTHKSAANYDERNATNQSAHNVAATNNTSTSINTIIRPQARESLNQLEFGSHSFSVAEISHKKKSLPESTTIIDNNHFLGSSMGLAPSLEPIAEQMKIPSANVKVGDSEVNVQLTMTSKVGGVVDTIQSTSTKANNDEEEKQSPSSENHCLATQTADLMSSPEEASEEEDAEATATPDNHSQVINDQQSPPNNTCQSCGTINPTFSKNQRKKQHSERKCTMCIEQMTVHKRTSAREESESSTVSSESKKNRQKKRDKMQQQNSLVDAAAAHVDNDTQLQEEEEEEEEDFDWNAETQPFSSFDAIANDNNNNASANNATKEDEVDDEECSNAHWLYHRCAKACIQMETSLSPYQLAVRTLTAIRSITNSNEDSFEEVLQPKLFAVLKDGKRRDLDFVFEVSERALELHEDGMLTEKSLQAVAAGNDNGGNDVVNEHDGDDESPLKTQPPDSGGTVNSGTNALDQLLDDPPSRGVQLKQQQQTTATSSSESGSPRKFRSRRKKRPTQTAQHGVNNPGGSNGGLDHTSNMESTGQDNKNNNEEVQADFPIQKTDDLVDMHDDEQWSFLPSGSQQLQSIEEDRGGDSPRRITRSMGLPNDDDANRDEQNDVAAKEVNDRAVDAAGNEYDGVEKVEDDIKMADAKEVTVTKKKAGGKQQLESMDVDNHIATNDDTNANKMGKHASNSNAEQEIVTETDINSAINVRNDVKDKTVHKAEGDDTRKQDKTLNTDVIDLVDNGVIGSNEKLDESRVDNTPRCSEESPVDGEEEVYSMVKTRKRGERIEKEIVRLMFTGITATRRDMQMIETIGAEFVDSAEEAHTATHVIASDGKSKLRRTPKLMICLCRTPNILSMEWLEQSAKEQRVLDTEGYLLLEDREAEKRYNFSMKDTIENGVVARRKRGGVLGGWIVYICSGVAGKKAPSMKEMKLIVDAAGGQIIKSISKPQSPFDPLKTIILTSEPCTKSQMNERGVAKAKGLGAKIFSTTWLFRTLITQQLVDVDEEEEEEDGDEIELVPMKDAEQPPVSRLVRSNSMESLVSTISVMSASPMKQGATKGSSRRSPNNNVRSPAGRNDDGSVRSTSTRGSRVTNLERAPQPSTSSKLQKRRLNFDDSKPLSSKSNQKDTQPSSSSNQKCTKPTTRDSFISSYQTLMSSSEAIAAVEDVAASQTHGLWLDYFNKTSPASSTKLASSAKPAKRKKGVRCRRGRNRSISPLVSSTTPGVTKTESKQPLMTSRSAAAFKLLLEDNSFITWESYVLFTLAHRTEELKCDQDFPANLFFPRPVHITNDATSNTNGKQLALNVNAGPVEPLEVFGSLQEVFSLHQQYQTSGMISEQVIALLAIRAIEAVSAMHSCGVAHCDINLDSFLVVRKAQKKASRKKKTDDEPDSYFLQVVGFGYKSIVLNCRQKCQESHFEHDYHCLANVIHLLLTGGVDIALHSTSSESIEFLTKTFIKGNLFLRGALSWCSLIDALLCSGELAYARNKRTAQFRLQYPVDIVGLATSDGEEDSRMHQFGWSCRILQELSEKGDGIVGFLDGLCLYNYRYIFPDIDLAMFTCKVDDTRDSFACYTTSERSMEQLMKKESNLQEDALALAQREMEFQEKVARFEQTRAEQESIVRKENEIRMKEKDLLQRERVHALEVERLEKMKEELLLREQRLHNGPGPSKRSPLAETDSRPTPRDGKNSRKRKHSKLPSPRNSQLVAGEGTSQNGSRLEPPSRVSRDSLQNKHSHPNEDFGGETFTSPPNAQSHKRKKNNTSVAPLDHGHVESQESRGSANSKRRKSPKTNAWKSLPTAGHAEEKTESHEDFRPQSQESQESMSSVKRRKRPSARKQHTTCSLLNLPRSPQKRSPTRESPRSSPRRQPKKVFITFGEESDSE